MSVSVSICKPTGNNCHVDVDGIHLEHFASSVNVRVGYCVSRLQSVRSDIPLTTGSTKYCSGAYKISYPTDSAESFPGSKADGA